MLRRPVDLGLLYSWSPGLVEARCPSGLTGYVPRGYAVVMMEQLRAATLGPERCRVEVHDFAVLPATRVDLTCAFVNSAGEPGPDA